jgi:hypothetical protein
MTKSLSSEQNQVWRQLTGEPGNYYSQAAEDEREIFKEWLKGLLKTDLVTVDFVKADGEFRSMKCTLAEQHGAKYTVNENKDRPSKKPNPEVCVVWDVNQNAWRSFRWDRIRKIEFTIG